MRTIRFGRTELQVSAISLGTWSYGGANVIDGESVGWSGHDDDVALAALRRAHEVGINHWDTADAYGSGRSERLISRIWKDVPRDEIVLASKVGWIAGEYDHYYEPALIRKQMEATLANLQVDCVDLYYLHHCDFGPDDRYLDGAIDLVRRFREEGKTRFIGLSDWDSEKVLRLADRVQPDVVQVYRNVFDDPYQASGLADWVAANDVGTVFFSPLKQGLLLGKYETPPAFGEGDFRSQIPEFTDQAFLDWMQENRGRIEERFADRPEPILHALLEALLVDTPGGCSLIGLRNPAQVDAAAAAEGVLSAEDAAWVRDLYRRS